MPNRAKLGMCSHLMHAAIPCELPLPLSPQHLRVIYLTSAPACVCACHLGPPHLPLQFCLASIHAVMADRAVARHPLAVGPPSWPASRLLGLRLSAAVEITSSYQKSEITNPATWDGLAAFLISMLPDMGATHPSSGPHLRVKSSRPVTGVAGIEQRVPNPESGGASWHSTQRGMCGYGIQKSGGSRLTLLALEDGCGPNPRPHHQLAKRFMETTCR